ncbi:hypothetical protein G3480_14940 [Thiorhodococcus mannitoliphagus]|uniref:Uncharacterized protein n=1 Tax=Thiorhodococcus mannitoliphagus TaxID=329406 RepID=A0A6P1DX81_9GAMM|nr:hypothetical protein [Thiorhodococcus mannitoliphagus]NEX21591.1 hypothetical protein [Thiorhodococcus mannitoliphagus]
MMSYDQLAEHYIREHDLREKSQEKAARSMDGPQELLGARSGENGEWRQETVNQAGPMGVIDAVAQDLESFIEFFERAPRCDLPATPPRRRNVHLS